MVQNPQEPTVFAAIPGGLNRAADPHDVPFGQFIRLRNTLTVADQGYMRTRDGLVAVTDRLFNYQFPILDTRLPWIVPFSPPTGPTEGELTLAAFPNRNLEASAGSPLSITFIVAGGADLGITTFEWDFTFDGVTFNIDSSGSSTSQINIYNARGLYLIRVRGTGSDTRVYTAEVTLDIGDVDNPDVAIPIIPDIPPEEPPADPIDQVLPTVAVSVNPTTIGVDESAEISWSTTDADTVTFFFPDGTSESVAASGTKVFSPTSTGSKLFVVDAFNSAGFASGNATLTVNAAPTAPVAGYLRFTNATQLRKHLESFDLAVEAREKDSDLLASFPGAVLPLLRVLTFNESVSASFDLTAAFNTAKTIATFSGNVLALPSGVNVATGQIQSYVPNVGLDAAIADVTVYRQGADFKVEVVDINGAAFPSDRIETTLVGDFVEAQFFLKITALEPGTSTTKTDFALDGLVTGQGFGTAGFPDDPFFVIIFFSPEVPFDTPNQRSVAAEIIDGQFHFVIPANAWQAGSGADKGIVMVRVDAQFDKREGNITNAHFAEMEFFCRERLSTE